MTEANATIKPTPMPNMRQVRSDFKSETDVSNLASNWAMSVLTSARSALVAKCSKRRLDRADLLFDCRHTFFHSCHVVLILI